MDRCSCCGGSVDTGGCLRCSSHVVMCAGCSAVLSCGCGRRSDEHRCRALVPVTIIVTIPEGAATIDVGLIPGIPVYSA